MWKRLITIINNWNNADWKTNISRNIKKQYDLRKRDLNQWNLSSKLSINGKVKRKIYFIRISKQVIKLKVS